MENVISRDESMALPDLMEGIASFAREEERRLISLCNAAFDYERKHIHLGNPSPEEKRAFGEALARLTTIAEELQNRHTESDLEWLLDRLRMSIGYLQNPMTEAEADAFLEKHFPG